MGRLVLIRPEIQAVHPSPLKALRNCGVGFFIIFIENYWDIVYELQFYGNGQRMF